MRRLLALFAVGAILLSTAASVEARPGGGGGGGGRPGGGGGARPGGYSRGYERGFERGFEQRPFYGYRNGVGPYGFGIGFGYWFSPLGYDYIPLTTRGGYADDSGYSIPAYPTTPDGYAPPPPSNEWGLQITDLPDGPAKKADLRKGDIILGVGQTRTQTLEDLQKALAASTGKAEIVFINGENKKVEKIPVTPVNGKIGVAVEPIDLP
jgi:hypothetical protein